MTFSFAGGSFEVTAAKLNLAFKIVAVVAAIFAAGRLAERMRHDHKWLMHEMCRIEIREGMEVPDECDVQRGNATQAAETAVS